MYARPGKRYTYRKPNSDVLYIYKDSNHPARPRKEISTTLRIINIFICITRSMIDIGNVDISGDKIEMLCIQMLAENGLAEKEQLTLDDFIMIMNQHQSELDNATLFSNETSK